MNSNTNYCHICKAQSQLTLCRNCYVHLFVPIKNHVSFAFEDFPKEIDKQALSDCIVLDFFKCGLTNARLSNFSHLRQLRISHCKDLTKIRLKDLPNLISFDALDSPNLSELRITNVPNLIAIDLSYCSKLNELNGDFTKVEYLSIHHTNISRLSPFPNAKFVDISSLKVTDL